MRGTQALLSTAPTLLQNHVAQSVTEALKSALAVPLVDVLTSAWTMRRELKQYLDQAFAKEQKVRVSDCERPADVAWLGMPFIIVGELEEARRFINQLSEPSRQVLEDCAVSLAEVAQADFQPGYLLIVILQCLAFRCRRSA